MKNKDLKKISKNLKLLLMDVDGVLTDGKLYYLPKGEYVKAFNVKDGLGIKIIQSLNIKTGIISGRDSKALLNRAKELELDIIITGKHSKLEHYEKLKIDFSLKDEEIAYIGDDLVDLPIIKRVGISACPNDAYFYIKSFCDYVSPLCGGKGALRDFIDYIINLREETDKVFKYYNI